MSINRGQRGTILPVPAPIGGLNARDPLAAMPERDASLLTNYFPYANRVDSRAGFTKLCTASYLSTGIGATNPPREYIHYLAKWAGQTGDDQLLAIQFYWTSSTSRKARILAISAAGTITTSRNVGTSFAGDNVYACGEWAQFSTASGSSYLIIPFNIDGSSHGATSFFLPEAFDGTNWTTLTMTVGGSSTVRGWSGCHGHQKRLWFFNEIFNATSGTFKPLSAYYLPVGAIQGDLIEFPLANYATKGGRIVSMRTITRDGGDGPDDLALFLTNRGQAIVFAGTDPASSSTWQLVGVFDGGELAAFMSIPESNGLSFADRDCSVRDSYAIKYGADVLLMLQTGLTSANSLLQGATIGEDIAISSKIQPLISDAIQAFQSLQASNVRAANWKMAHAPAIRHFFISIPTAETETTIPAGAPVGDVVQTTTTSDVYVMNTETKAWAKYSAINIRDMVVIGGKTVYFNDGSLNVYKFDGTATTDNGAAITFECRQAYHYLNSPNNKSVTLMQPMLQATGNFSLTVQADADFNAGTISSYTSYTVGSTQNLQPWLSANQYGRAIATHMKGQTSAGVLSWYATNMLSIPAQGI